MTSAALLSGAAALALALVACGENGAAGQAAGDPLPSNGWASGDGGSDALIEGRVERAVDGCVSLAVDGGSSLEILWPEGWTIKAVADGYDILRADGSKAVAVGDSLSGGGSFLPDTGCAGDGTVSLQDDLR